MPHVTRVQLNYANQTNYTNAVTASMASTEVVGYGVKPVHQRVESKSIRSSRAARSTHHFQPFKVGAAGGIDVEVPTKGFAFWLPHMFGTASSSATATNGTTWSASILTGKGTYFSLQENFPLYPGDSDSAFTFIGTKVVKWSAECKVDEPLNVHFDVDAYDYSTNTALTAASFETNFNLLTFVGGTVSIGGTSVNIREWKVETDLGYEPDKERYVRGDTRKLEPQQRKPVEVTADLLLDWESLAQFNRFAAATASGALASVQAVFTGPSTINGGAVYPSLTVTIPNARFDEALPKDVEGADPLEQPVKVMGFQESSTNGAITAVYVAEDDG